MKKVAVCLIGIVLVAVSVSAHEGRLTFAPVLAEATPAVVSIQVERRSQSNLWFNPGSAGSGVIIDAPKGHVVTNHHVIDRAEKITVTLKDRRSFEAELIGSDPGTDVALLAIEADDLQALPLGDSDELAVGDLVVAIGNPLGLGQTATSGIVSALGRSGFTREGYEDFIQTDAAINRGNSGGALVDLNGQLVGINSLIVSPSRTGVSAGLGFAVPANIVRTVIGQLVEHGAVRRALLGVGIRNVLPDEVDFFDLPSNDGAVVEEVRGGSAAAEAGIEPGDVIVRLDDEEVSNANDLRNKVGLAMPGDDVEIVVVRDGKSKRFDVTLGSLDGATGSTAAMSNLAGAQLRDLSRQHRLFGRIDGVEVVEVERGSPAWNLGLEPGDVILAVNRGAVANLREFEAAVAEGTPYSMLLQRGQRRLFVVVR